MRAPGYPNVDLSVSKRVETSGQHYIMFRCEVFNAFNRPNFGRQAEALLLKRLDAITLADLATNFDALCAASGWGIDGPAKKTARRQKSVKR